MLDIEYSTAFKKETKRAASQGKDVTKMFVPIAILLNGENLPLQYKDHPLKGDWSGSRDFHAEPDWIVIYRVVGGILRLERTGTHADLFGG
jgi:mRNA interferase YafQ